MKRLVLWVALLVAAIASMLITADDLVANRPALEPRPEGTTIIDRTNKGDRLVAARTSTQPREIISAVEVVGVRDVAIIYRNRAGEVVFITDPVNNVTIVAKGVVLPEVTVREKTRDNVQPVPATEIFRDREPKRALQPGCSWHTNPTDRAVRCIAHVTGWNVAVR